MKTCAVSRLAAVLLALATPYQVMADAQDDSTPASSAADAPAEQQPTSDVTCLRETGTRIKSRPGRCNGSVGRSYGSEELRATGLPSVGDALQRIDPSIRSLGR